MKIFKTSRQNLPFTNYLSDICEYARQDIEQQLGQPIVSPLNAKDKQALEITQPQSRGDEE